MDVLKKSVNMKGGIDMVLKLVKYDNKANYLISWTCDNREMQGKVYHGKREALKVFRAIHNNYNDKVRWFDEIRDV